MKRENFNTAIALSGLVLAAFSTYIQLKPERDKLDLVVTTSFNTNSSFKLIEDGYLPKEMFGDNKKLAGPASITLELSNNMSRPVTIKRIKVELTNGEKTIIIYSHMLNPLDKKTMEALFSPKTIDEHSVNKIELFLNIPIYYDEKVSSCFGRLHLSESKDEKINNVEYCYFSNGIDFLGNKIQFREYEGGAAMLSKTLGGNRLTYRLTVITGDNSEIVKMAIFD